MVFKKRFPILCSPNQYPYETQAKLPLALGGLHNFIMHQNGRKESEWWENLLAEETVENLQRILAGGATRDLEDERITGVDSIKDDFPMKVFRDELAERMWRDYVNYTR